MLPSARPRTRNRTLKALKIRSEREPTAGSQSLTIQRCRIPLRFLIQTDERLVEPTSGAAVALEEIPEVFWLGKEKELIAGL